MHNAKFGALPDNYFYNLPVDIRSRIYAARYAEGLRERTKLSRISRINELLLKVLQYYEQYDIDYLGIKVMNDYILSPDMRKLIYEEDAEQAPYGPHSVAIQISPAGISIKTNKVDIDMGQPDIKNGQWTGFWQYQIPNVKLSSFNEQFLYLLHENLVKWSKLKKKPEPYFNEDDFYIVFI